MSPSLQDADGAPVPHAIDLFADEPAVSLTAVMEGTRRFRFGNGCLGPRQSGHDFKRVQPDVRLAMMSTMQGPGYRYPLLP